MRFRWAGIWRVAVKLHMLQGKVSQLQQKLGVKRCFKPWKLLRRVFTQFLQLLFPRFSPEWNARIQCRASTYCAHVWSHHGGEQHSMSYPRLRAILFCARTSGLWRIQVQCVQRCAKQGCFVWHEVKQGQCHPGTRRTTLPLSMKGSAH